MQKQSIFIGTQKACDANYAKENGNNMTNTEFFFAALTCFALGGACASIIEMVNA